MLARKQSVSLSFHAISLSLSFSSSAIAGDVYHAYCMCMSTQTALCRARDAARSTLDPCTSAHGLFGARSKQLLWFCVVVAQALFARATAPVKNMAFMCFMVRCLSASAPSCMRKHDFTVYTRGEGSAGVGLSSSITNHVLGCTVVSSCASNDMHQ